MLSGKLSAKTGMLMIVICAMLWSTGGLFVKLIDWHPMVICGLRGIIAGSFIFVMMRILKLGSFVINRTSLTAAFFLGLTCTLFVISNKLTTAANAIMLQSTNPVFIILFSMIFRRQLPSRRDLITVLIILFGISLFFLDQLSAGGLLGSLLAVVSGVCLAAVFIITCDSNDLGQRISGAVLGHFFSGLLSIPFYFLYPPKLDPVPVMAILFLGIFQLGLAYALLMIASSACSPLMVSLISMLEPVFNPVWVALALHEMPGPPALLGSFIVIITLSCWCIGNSKAEKAANIL